MGAVMTRDELVGLMAEPMLGMSWHEDAGSALRAISAAGYAIVPVAATDAMVEAALPLDAPQHEINSLAANYAAMVEAGRVG